MNDSSLSPIYYEIENYFTGGHFFYYMLFLFLLVILSSSSHYFYRVESKGIKPTLGSWIINALISVNASVWIYLICMYYDLPLITSTFMIAISAYLGVETIEIIIKIVRKKILEIKGNQK